MVWTENIFEWSHWSSYILERNSDRWKDFYPFVRWYACTIGYVFLLMNNNVRPDLVELIHRYLKYKIIEKIDSPTIPIVKLDLIPKAI